MKGAHKKVLKRNVKLQPPLLLFCGALARNKVRVEGVVRLAEALQCNTSLTLLDLGAINEYLVVMTSDCLGRL